MKPSKLCALLVVIECLIASAGCSDEQSYTPALTGNWATTCEIDSRGVLRCWGARFESVEQGVDPFALRGTPIVVSEGHWQAVSAGTTHACAIRDTGSLWCWGRNVAGQLGDGTQVDNREVRRVGTASDWIALATGGGHSCGIREGGELYCWGGPDYGQSVENTTGFTTQPTRILGQWRVISSHYYLTCGLQEDDSLWCWGDEQDETGQLVFSPVQVEGAWKTIAVGVLQSWGIQPDGTLWAFTCSGGHFSGGTSPTECEVLQVGEDTDWGDSVGAAYHACAVKQDGSLWCFGRNDNGQSGGLPSEPLDSPTQVGMATDWVEVIAGAGHSCARNLGGEVQCWGSNAAGQLGIGDYPYRSRPSQVGERSNWGIAKISGGISCGLRGEELKCWGVNMGFANPLSLVPTAMPGSFVEVRPQIQSMCGIDAATHTLVCRRYTDADIPPGDPTGLRLSEFTTGRRMCAIGFDDGKLHCFGSEPETYDGDWRQASTGDNHSCGIVGDGELHCWGDNRKGQLGLQGPNKRLRPVRVGTETWLKVAVATDRTCAIQDQGGHGPLVCWGQVKELGPRQQSLPRSLDQSVAYTQLSIGYNRGCAIRDDHSLWCWGDNRLGEVGVGTSGGQIATPTRVGLNNEWQSVTVDSHACATTIGGEMYCWGSGRYGQLGEGSSVRYEPTLISSP